MALQQELYRIPVETSRRVRKDGLPENYPYRDEGCSIASECLKCPLPHCRYDMPTPEQRKVERQGQIKEMRLVGFRTDYIAHHFKVTIRTIQRAIHDLEGS